MSLTKIEKINAGIEQTSMGHAHKADNTTHVIENEMKLGLTPPE